MNLLGPTLLLYLLVGFGVAAALYLRDSSHPGGERWLRLATAVPFWPFYLPILLTQTTPVPLVPAAGEDELARTLTVVERELDAALSTLEEWIGIPNEPRQRIDTLRQTWHAQAERLREMDRLLSRPEYAVLEGDAASASAPLVRQSLSARQQNVERLRQVRQQTEADLLASLALVRELASRIHLARFTDAPAAQAEELIAAAIQTFATPPAAPESIQFIKKAE